MATSSFCIPATLLVIAPPRVTFRCRNKECRWLLPVQMDTAPQQGSFAEGAHRTAVTLQLQLRVETEATAALTPASGLELSAPDKEKDRPGMSTQAQPCGTAMVLGGLPGLQWPQAVSLRWH